MNSSDSMQSKSTNACATNSIQYLCSPSCISVHQGGETVTAHLLRPDFSKNVPTSPAATAIPPTIAAPTNPSFATFSSISPFKLPACRFAGSSSNNNSLYLLASA